MIPFERESDPRRRLILALDLPTADEALRLADRLRPDLAWVKVGLQLFASEGPDVVRRLVSMGLRVFVDLKLHDIPNTMASAARELSGLGAGLATVHASAGPVALAATAAATRESAGRGPTGRPPALLGVTVLTSLDAAQLETILGHPVSPADHALHLAKTAIAAGLDGLVASPKEIRVLREELGADPVLVIPGIRPAWASSDDQSRIATPAQALRDGADFLVVGRPITQSDDPRVALQRVLDEMSAAQ